MKTPTRTFQKSVELTTQAQYSETKNGLRLVRWRLTADGVQGLWQRPKLRDRHALWPNRLPADYAP